MLLSEAPGLPRAARRGNVRRVSLNRTEHTLFAYLEGHAEERQFWQAKVRELMSTSRDGAAIARALAGELRRYAGERGSVGAIPAQVMDDKGLAHSSFLNLAEYLMRIWGPPRPARRPMDNEIS